MGQWGAFCRGYWYCPRKISRWSAFRIYVMPEACFLMLALWVDMLSRNCLNFNVFSYQKSAVDCSLANLLSAWGMWMLYLYMLLWCSSSRRNDPMTCCDILFLLCLGGDSSLLGRECPVTMTMLRFGGWRMIDGDSCNVLVIWGFVTMQCLAAEANVEARLSNMCIIECFV